MCMCPYIGELASINDICEITSRKKIKIEGFRLLGFYSTPSPSRTLFLLPLSSNLSAFTGNQEDTPSIFFLLRASIFLRRSSLIESLSPPSSQGFKEVRTTGSRLWMLNIEVQYAPEKAGIEDEIPVPRLLNTVIKEGGGGDLAVLNLAEQMFYQFAV